MSEYYNFTQDDARQFASTSGIAHHEHNGQIEFLYCPYCHGGSGKDKKTFHISLSTGQFECKRSSCSVRGNMITLAKDFADSGFHLSKDVEQYYNINNSGRYKKFRDSKRAIEVREPAINYLCNRGISEKIIKSYEITTDPKDSNILVFPFKDENGELQFVKYRNINPIPGKSKEWCIAGNYKKILFGMNRCEGFEQIVITEGQIDSLSVAEAGIKNAVSVPTGKNGFTWKPNVWNWLVKFDEIVVFGDHENGEITLAREIAGFFPKRVRIVRPSDYRGCKDANEILQKHGKEAIVEAVNNAEVSVSLRIKNLSEVESVDLSKLKCYPTHISMLDKSIGGGFHDGEVIILTGKCGEGKSTLASQIVARMLANDLKVFCYSGELPGFMFKAWIDRQIGNGKSKTAEIDAISEWYRNKCFIYDNSANIDEESELFNVMEQAVKDIGCKFILIDNLMTAMEDNPGEDLYRQQSRFITRLTKFAQGFNVIIMLVAHPKKGDDISNDSISGSGDITNRASIVLNFRRSKEQNDISDLYITKNRTTGILINDEKKGGIKMRYERNSMRLTAKGDDFVEFMNDSSISDGFQYVTDTEELEVPF